MNDHQEQQQQWSTGIWSLEDELCATKGRAGEVTQALGGAQKIMCGSQTLEQEAVKLKLTWGSQNIKDTRAIGCLPRNPQGVDPA